MRVAAIPLVENEMPEIPVATGSLARVCLVYNIVLLYGTVRSCSWSRVLGDVFRDREWSGTRGIELYDSNMGITLMMVGSLFG